MGTILKIVIALVSVYLINLLFFRFSGNISNSVSLYFYSAIFQGNAALVTLTAMFIIFKKQALDNRSVQIERIIVDYLKSSVNICINYGKIHDLKFLSEDAIDRLDGDSKNKIKGLQNSSTWKSRFEELEKIENQNKGLWNKVSSSLAGLFIVLIFSSILLPLSSYVHENLKVEFFLFEIILFLEITCLSGLYFFIKEVLKD